MINKEIERQLEELFQFEQHLQQLLEEEQYEEYEQQQAIFSEKIKFLLKSNSAETLSSAIPQLKKLQKKVAALQNNSSQHFKQLKEKSLLQKRNKSKIAAYKK